MPDQNGDISPGELARRVTDVLSRLQDIVNLVENRYVRKDILDLYKETINASIQSMKEALESKADKTGLASLDRKADQTTVDGINERLKNIEDTNKWIVRLVGGFIVLGILAFVFSNGGGVGK